MATIRKMRNKWQCQVRINRRQISKVFDKKSEASKWGSATETAIRENTFVDNSMLNSIRLSELLWIFYEKDKHKTKYKERFKSEVENMLRFPITSLFLTELTPQILAEFRDQQLDQGKSASTVKKYLGLISRAINKGRRELSLPLNYNPVQIIEKPKEGKGRDRVLSDEEFDHLIHVASQSPKYWLKDIIIFAEQTLMRQGEILMVKRIDINPHKQTLYIGETKNDNPRTIGLSPKAMEVIRKQPPNIDGVLFNIRNRHELDYWFTKAVKEAGITDFKFHDLRHCGASRLAEAGWNTQELLAQGGWLDVRMLTRYVKIKGEHLAQKMRAV